MKKDSFYFPHDYNSASDQKILQLRAEHGNSEAYGIYWMLIEAMAQESNGYLTRGAIGGLSLGYGLDKTKVLTIIEYSIQIGLLKENSQGIYSQRMIEHKGIRNKYKKAGVEGAKKRWGKSSSSKDRGAIKGATSTPNAKERKGKERKNIYSSRKCLTNELCCEIAKQYSVNDKSVMKIRDNLKGWCEAKGKTYKNYKSALQNWVRMEIERKNIVKVQNTSVPVLPEISEEERQKNIQTLAEMKSNLMGIKS